MPAALVIREVNYLAWRLVDELAPAP